MDFEHFERGYLLPKGCKDLIDVINLFQEKRNPTILLKAVSTPSDPEPQSKGDLLVSEPITVRELALLLKEKPFKIIADLPEKPKEAILKVGFSDGIYGHSKGGQT